MLRAHPAVLALWVFVAGFVLIWAGLYPWSGDPLTFCPDVPQVEGTSIDTGPAPWPPGTMRCDGVGVAAAGRFALALALAVAAFAAAFV